MIVEELGPSAALMVECEALGKLFTAAFAHRRMLLALARKGDVCAQADLVLVAREIRVLKRKADDLYAKALGMQAGLGMVADA